MTTEEATPAPAGASEEAAPFPPPILELPPLVLKREPTPLLESEPTLLVESEPLSLEEASATSPSLAAETQTSSVEYTPPSPTLPAATPKPARRDAGTNAPDPFAVGVRLLRMAPAWLLFMTVICGALVLVLGWMKAGEKSPAAASTPKLNDARAVQPAPKPDAPAPQTAVAVVAQQPPAAQPAQPAAPAPIEQPAPAAPKAVETVQAAPPAPTGDAGAKFTVQVGSHRDQSEANEQVSRLRATGFEARAVAAELPGRGTWYRVQVGRFADRAEASKAVGQLHAKGAAASAIIAPLQN